MKAFLFLLVFFITTESFSQQKKIDKHLAELEASGALNIDSFDLKGEKIDSFAHYPGGEMAWRKYLEQNVSVLVDGPTNKGVKAGRYKVWVKFIVDADGTISDIEAITSFGYMMEEGVIKLIRKSGKWRPAIAGGVPVESKVKVAVNVEFSSG
jgi:hypothetical protein